ncbi:MAG: response regulator [Myxococcales bacterium]|nr:response regulator [Myxococcales bacterium]
MGRESGRSRVHVHRRAPVLRAQPRPPRGGGSNVNEGISSSAPSVLVIDDDPDILEVTRFVLENAGYRVATAANGADALASLRGKAKPGLILLDLMMPVMNGWEFRAEQTRDPELASVPVVIITGAGNAAARAALTPAGGHHRLHLPARARPGDRPSRHARFVSRHAMGRDAILLARYDP